MAPQPPVAPEYERLAVVDLEAPAALLQRLRSDHLIREERCHAPAGHARHLAALWNAPLHETARASLLYADGSAVLAVVPADRKISAPRLRVALGRADLRVLRADRGTGRIGWRGLLPPPGPIPAVPQLFRAAGIVDRLVLRSPRLIIALSPEHSVSLQPCDYLRAVAAQALQFAGSTRLLPEGGIVNDDPYPDLRPAADIGLETTEPQPPAQPL